MRSEQWVLGLNVEKHVTKIRSQQHWTSIDNLNRKRDIFEVLRRFPFWIPKQIQLLWFKALFWMGPATRSIGPECHCSRQCCMAPVVGVKPWTALHQKQKLFVRFSAMLAQFFNQYAITHGAAPTICKALHLVLWECKERLQLFIIPREEYSLLFKVLLCYANRCAWLECLGGKWWGEDRKDATWGRGPREDHPNLRLAEQLRLSSH